MRYSSPVVSAILLMGLISSSLFIASCHAQTTDQDPAEVQIGERLFLETRFAQAYSANPDKADPALEYTLTMDEPLRGPFAGKTMNCRACHMVDEHQQEESAGIRTYADFSHSSPIPERRDGHHMTERNSMSLVNISVSTEYGNLFHYDGEFNSMEDLVRATLTGRNYGWLPSESKQAVKHIANVIRLDDGKDELGKEFGGSYRKILAATDKTIPTRFRLPGQYRVNVANASDGQIMDVVSRLIAAYVNNLHFAQDQHGNYTGSPYDHFLKLNRLPQQPGQGESAQVYANRLLKAINQLASPIFITAKDGRFKSHKQAFVFGEQELKGMKLFFTRGDQNNRGGNCVSCHTAPHFSDYAFHNTGITQFSYDEAHGSGSFSKLAIPDLTRRNDNYEQYLPATSAHPRASGQFRSAVNIDLPGYTDLGLWNVFGNPDLPSPQAKLKKIICKTSGSSQCTTERLLSFTIAAFKTPVLRDLGHSNPYFHNGHFNTLKEAVSFYLTNSAMAKSRLLRNPDRRLLSIHLGNEDVKPLIAFLKALNEDYE